MPGSSGAATRSRAGSFPYDLCRLHVGIATRDCNRAGCRDPGPLPVMGLSIAPERLAIFIDPRIAIRSPSGHPADRKPQNGVTGTFGYLTEAQHAWSAAAQRWLHDAVGGMDGVGRIDVSGASHEIAVELLDAPGVGVRTNVPWSKDWNWPGALSQPHPWYWSSPLRAARPRQAHNPATAPPGRAAC